MQGILSSDSVLRPETCGREAEERVQVHIVDWDVIWNLTPETVLRAKPYAL